VIVLVPGFPAGAGSGLTLVLGETGAAVVVVVPAGFGFWATEVVPAGWEVVGRLVAGVGVVSDPAACPFDVVVALPGPTVLVVAYPRCPQNRNKPTTIPSFDSSDPGARFRTPYPGTSTRLTLPAPTVSVSPRVTLPPTVEPGWTVVDPSGTPVEDAAPFVVPAL